MSLRVTLAGATLRWRFPGSRAWDEWAEARPWTGPGGVVVLRVASPSAIARWVDQVDADLRAADGGRSIARIRRIRRWSATALDSVRDWVGVAPGGSAHTQKRAVADELVSAPAVFVVEEPLAAVSILEGLRELVEQIPKLRDGARVCCVAFDTGTHPAAPDALALDRGDIAEPVLVPGASRDVLFRRYLHARLAWEAGGDPDVALHAAGMVGAAVIDDRRLEDGLNRFATRALGEGEERAVVESRELVRAFAAGNLRAIGAPRIPGWIARRLLLRGGGGPLEPALRQALVCLPLARELVSRCFELEALVRMRLLGRLDKEPSAEAARLWADFSAGRLPLEKSLYPQGSPAVPLDAWSFASFGEFLSAAGVSSSEPPQRVRVLRNAIAHGHYVTWPAIETLLEAERAIAGR